MTAARRNSDQVSRARGSLRAVEAAERQLASADTPEQVLEAGSALTTAHQWMRRPGFAGGLIGDLHQEACEIRDRATLTWATLSLDPAVQAAALATIDPTARPDSERLTLAAATLPDWTGPLLQLSLSFGLLLDDPLRIWQPHHQVLLLTDHAATTLAAGGTPTIRISGDAVNTALVPSVAVAQTAAVLWAPDAPEGAYAHIRDAVAAAKAVTGERSVASAQIRAWAQHALNARAGHTTARGNSTRNVPPLPA